MGSTFKEVVSTIVRFHDVTRIALLERAIQSLHGQTGAKVQPIIVLQRFSEEAAAVVRDAVSRQWFFTDQPVPEIINCAGDGSQDMRSALLNRGVERHLKLKNRYLAFLDYDDVMYSHAYRILVEALQSSGAAIAFASVEVARVVSLKDYEFVYELSKPYRGKNKLDLMKDNFCPLHSYLIDTSRVEARELRFREELSRLEDYDFLLRVAGRNPCDFSSLDKNIGLYILRTDGTNSTPNGEGSVTERESGDDWKTSTSRLSALRSSYEVRFFASDF